MNVGIHMTVNTYGLDSPDGAKTSDMADSPVTTLSPQHITNIQKRESLPDCRYISRQKVVTESYDEVTNFSMLTYVNAGEYCYDVKIILF